MKPDNARRRRGGASVRHGARRNIGTRATWRQFAPSLAARHHRSNGEQRRQLYDLDWLKAKTRAGYGEPALRTIDLDAEQVRRGEQQDRNAPEGNCECSECMQRCVDRGEAGDAAYGERLYMINEERWKRVVECERSRR